MTAPRHIRTVECSDGTQRWEVNGPNGWEPAEMTASPTFSESDRRDPRWRVGEEGASRATPGDPLGLASLGPGYTEEELARHNDGVKVCKGRERLPLRGSDE